MRVTTARLFWERRQEEETEGKGELGGEGGGGGLVGGGGKRKEEERRGGRGRCRETKEIWETQAEVLCLVFCLVNGPIDRKYYSSSTKPPPLPRFAAVSPSPELDSKHDNHDHPRIYHHPPTPSPPDLSSSAVDTLFTGNESEPQQPSKKAKPKSKPLRSSIEFDGERWISLGDEGFAVKTSRGRFLVASPSPVAHPHRWPRYVPKFLHAELTLGLGSTRAELWTMARNPTELRTVDQNLLS
ncbi:hypothetical protein Droror1_Dr00008699 [Drosera rotundifolia]